MDPTPDQIFKNTAGRMILILNEGQRVRGVWRYRADVIISGGRIIKNKYVSVAE